MKTLQELQQDWGNSTCGKEPEQYIYDYMENHMQAYADQQVNLVLTHAVDTIKKEYGESNAYFILTYLESLKIKQP